MGFDVLILLKIKWPEFEEQRDFQGHAPELKHQKQKLIFNRKKISFLGLWRGRGRGQWGRTWLTIQQKQPCRRVDRAIQQTLDDCQLAHTVC